MALYTIWNAATGDIIRSGEANDPLAQRREGEDVIVGKALDDTRYRVNPETGEEYEHAAPLSREELVRAVIAERERRLAAGFDFDFGGARGSHHIGTTTEDMVGWREVSDMAFKAMARGDSAKQIGIATDSGPTIVTALEWLDVLDAAEAFRQPIWTASFRLQALAEIPADFAADIHWS